MANFCPQCGDPLYPGQKFCEKCGAKIEEHFSGAEANAPPTAAPVAQQVNVPKGGLFDPSRMFYILKEKYWDWGSGPIMDEKGNEIGKMHRKLFSLRAKIEFQELDGTVSASIHKKLLAIKPTYTLFDANEQVLGRLKKTFWSWLRPKFYFEDPYGNKIMEAQGKFMGFDFTIYDMSGKVLAEIKKTDKWRDIFIGGIFDFSDTYAVKIVDPNVDRRLILGFVIAIDNTLHDNN